MICLCFWTKQTERGFCFYLKYANIKKQFNNPLNDHMAKNKANIDEKTLAELKKALVEKKSKITDELETFAGKSKDLKGDFDTKFEQVGDRPEENASEVEMYENNLGVEHQLENDLAAINEALVKIDDGTYGICTNCGKPQTIDVKRLKAFPEAKTCIKCQNDK